MKRHLLLGTSMLSAAAIFSGMSGTANAQSVEQDSAAEATGLGSGEIIVTARRRDERLQDVPIAVSAISGEQAERTGIDNTEALVISTPSLDFGRSGSFAALPFLRGVGTSFSGAGVEPAVAIYVDDVYYGSTNANLMALDNIESVQVLKGPQGTLFGRNATGGVIQIQTKSPSPDAVEGKIQGSYGNYDTFSGSLYANFPLSDNAALNIAAAGSKQSDGYGMSVTTGAETQKAWDWNIRGKLLVNLGDTTTVLLSGDYSKQRSDFGANQGVFPGTIGFGGTEFVGDFNTVSAGTDFSEIEQGGVSLKIDHETSFANIVSISAYRFTRMQTLLDYDASPAPLLELDLTSPIDTFSQEIRLVSNSEGPLQWVVGGFYYHSKAEYTPASLTGLINDPALMDPTWNLSFNDAQTLNSIAGFAEGTYEFTPEAHLTLGIRYTRDSFKLTNEGFFLSSSTVPAFPIPGTMYELSEAFSKVTYRAILDYKFTPGILGYASYSRGFKSGGYNLPEPGIHAPDMGLVVAPVRPEVLDAFELGLKTQSGDGKITFNIAAFYYDYKDLAVSISGLTSQIQVNAAAAEIMGIDADFTIVPLPGFQITGGVGLLDTEYTKFPGGPVFSPNPAPPFGNIPAAADLSGNRTQRAPKFTFSIAPSYTAQVGNGELTIAASYYHNSGYFSDPENRLRQSSYDLVNGSIGYQLETGIGARLWAKNLFDKHYFSFLQADAFKDAATFAPPRTYGVTVWMEF